MNKTKSHPIKSRRNFLKLTAAVGATAVGGYLLSEYTPWLDYDQKESDLRKPFNKKSTMSAEMQELVRYATLAANGHNAQPWKFTIKENTIEIIPDYTRQLLVIDPDNRELWISLGCALENLLIAARAIGYSPEVTYPNTEDLVRINLTKGTPQKDSLFDSIPIRQSTRSEYNGKPINGGDLEQIQKVRLEQGVSLHLATNQADLKTVLDYTKKGNLSQYADKEFVNELISWLRFNKKEALASFDGLYARCSGNPEVPRWIGKMFVARTKPQQQADNDVKKLRSSAGAVVIASDLDDKTAWVRTGQVCERLMLKMTSLNIKTAFLNQPLEVSNLRLQFKSALALGESKPQLLLRFGYADQMTRSLRRPVEQVII